MKTRVPETAVRRTGALALIAAGAAGLPACGSTGPRPDAGTDRLLARLESLEQLAQAAEARVKLAAGADIAKGRK